MRVAVIGEILWDLVGDSRHLGGAPLNFALHLRALGHEPLLISAVGDDELGEAALQGFEARGLSTSFIRRLKGHATGTVTVSLDEHGLPEYVIHRPAAYDFPSLPHERTRELIDSEPSWIYFGTLQQTSSEAHALTASILDKLRRAKRFYDLNLRPHSYKAGLVSELLHQANVVKLNEPEAGTVARSVQLPTSSLEEFCRALRQHSSLEAVCVTRGAHGCCLLLGDVFVEAPGYRVSVADTIGAGDAFSAALLHGIHGGWPPHQIADFANRVGALIASLPGGAPLWRPEQLQRLARSGDAP